MEQFWGHCMSPLNFTIREARAPVAPLPPLPPLCVLPPLASKHSFGRIMQACSSGLQNKNIYQFFMVALRVC